MDIEFLDMLRTKLALAIFSDNVGDNSGANKVVRELLVTVDNELERAKNESNCQSKTAK